MIRAKKGKLNSDKKAKVENKDGTGLPVYSFAEELTNAISHGVGVILSFAMMVLLILIGRSNHNPAQIASFAIYGACSIAMFLSSTLYHSISNQKAKKILRVFDHCSIFIFIAGTYTPTCILTLGNKKGIGLLIGVWAIAIFGIVFKIMTYGKYSRYNKISTFLYILMGWLVIFSIGDIYRASSTIFIILLFIGGLLYTIGTIFYRVKRYHLTMLFGIFSCWQPAWHILRHI
uniref:PAQR family membrane homeostasis protein TrhA n=1 Tax=Ndongobacter massiliensis TaxID=1871025 RepID=UPI000A4E17E1|nr:hemolysin III family protein [Ndongobacter massiliensis]